MLQDREKGKGRVDSLLCVVKKKDKDIDTNEMKNARDRLLLCFCKGNIIHL